MTQHKQYTKQHKHFGRVRAVPRLCELYPGICLTTEENHGKTSVGVAEECHLPSDGRKWVLVVVDWGYGYLTTLLLLTNSC
jgi:hypothetical protein